MIPKELQDEMVIGSLKGEKEEERWNAQEKYLPTVQLFFLLFQKLTVIIIINIIVLIIQLCNNRVGCVYTR